MLLRSCRIFQNFYKTGFSSPSTNGKANKTLISDYSDSCKYDPTMGITSTVHKSNFQEARLAWSTKMQWKTEKKEYFSGLELAKRYVHIGIYIKTGLALPLGRVKWFCQVEGARNMEWHYDVGKGVSHTTKANFYLTFVGLHFPWRLGVLYGSTNFCCV